MKFKHYVANYILNPPHELSVAVIGCGGTGSQVMTALGRMNYALRQLGHPGLQVAAYDADIVTEANCGRQLFAEQEIGHNKAEVLTTKLNMFFGTRWDCVQSEYNSDSPTANIVISCVDTVKARKMIAQRLREQNMYQENRVHYWLDFGNAQKTGQVILGTAFRKVEQPKGKRGCVGYLKSVNEMFDLSQLSDAHSGPSCSLAQALTKQDLFINSTLANLGMALLWKLFYGVIDIQGAYLNLDTMKVNPIKIEKQAKPNKRKSL